MQTQGRGGLASKPPTPEVLEKHKLQLDTNYSSNIVGSHEGVTPVTDPEVIIS